MADKRPSTRTSANRVKEPFTLPPGMMEWLRERALKNKRSKSYELEFLLEEFYLEETKSKDAPKAQ